MLLWENLPANVGLIQFALQFYENLVSFEICLR